jgi:hypothetical protein
MTDADMQLIEISAWNDSGGGFLHRLFDGHPALDVWPFELLLGHDDLTPDRFGAEWFRGRFRWPRLQGVDKAAGGALFDQIGDNELKAVLVELQGAKHRDFPVEVSLDTWRDRAARRFTEMGARTQAVFLTAYVRSFFELWPQTANCPEHPVLGHCPVAILDAPEIWADFPNARLIHVVRSPVAGFCDMRARHPRLEPESYVRKWCLINGLAASLAGKYPDRVRLVRFDDLLSRRESAMRAICQWVGLAFDDIVLRPTWCGRPLDPAHMGPFGGVPEVSAAREARVSKGVDAATSDTIERLTAGAAALVDCVAAAQATGD